MKKIFLGLLVLMLLIATALFASTIVQSDVGGWHSYVQNNIYRAGFYGCATASTDIMSYNKAYTECKMTVFRNGSGVCTQGDNDEDTTPPVSSQTYFAAPGYVTSVPGTYVANFYVTATLHRPGYSPTTDTVSFDAPAVSIVGTRVD